MESEEHRWAGWARRARAGDRPALDALCAEVWPRLRRWALLETGEVALAEDAAQDSLVRLIRHLPQWSPERPFGPWLRAVVRNASRDARTRRGEVRSADREVTAGPDGPDRRLDLRRAADRALAAFARCTPRQREVLDLCDLRGHTPAEAAERLGIAQGTARALLHQGRSVLRAELVGDEVRALLGEVDVEV